MHTGTRASARRATAEMMRKLLRTTFAALLVCCKTIAERSTVTMLSRASSAFCRQAASRCGKPTFSMAQRSMVTVHEALTAEDARKVSGYVQIDYTISEDVPVYEAVQRLAAFNIGCLVTLDANGMPVWLFQNPILYE